MTCEQALLLISGHIDHCNTEAEEAQLREHLDGCETCRSLLQAFQETDTGILTLQEAAPETLCDDVMRAIRKEVSGRKRKHRQWGSLAAAAVLVLIVGVGAYAAPSFEKADTSADTVQTVHSTAEETPALSRMRMSDPDLAADQYAAKRSAEPVSPQELADEHGVPVAVVHELYPSMEICEVELLEDGTLLYILPDVDAAGELCRMYPGTLFEPAVLQENPDCSYAVIVPE